MDEFGFINDLLKPLAGDGAFALGDDAAQLPELDRNDRWIVTKDAMVEGVHFRPADPADLVARKLLRTNLSDLAAMGAEPVGYFLSLMLSPRCDRDWLSHFCAGLAKDQRIFGIRVLGGDTTSTPATLGLSATLLGAAPEGQELRRNGAQPGDAVWVSGTLGDAALGLQVLEGAVNADPATAEFLARRYRLPEPRVELGQALRGKATACLDVSDGLLADLGHIAEQSGVGIEVAADLLPISDAAQRLTGDRDRLVLTAASGGDDYELAFTLPAGALPPAVSGVPSTCVGKVVDAPGVRLLRSGRIVPVDKPGWRHF